MNFFINKLIYEKFFLFQIIYWDEQSIYMEHKFITPKDKFVNAIVITRTRLINCNAEDVMNHMLKIDNDIDIERASKIKPEISLELEKWMEYNTMSSETLRKETV